MSIPIVLSLENKWLSKANTQVLNLTIEYHRENERKIANWFSLFIRAHVEQKNKGLKSCDTIPENKGLKSCDTIPESALPMVLFWTLRE